MIIEPGRIINDFIEPNKRQYAIPVYQRNYEWSREQCVKLFADIVQAYKKGCGFTAAFFQFKTSLKVFMFCSIKEI